jgi:large subunit ribosomal protein L17
MRHRNTGRQFGRNSSHRKALFRNLVTSLLEHGRIETTEAKAKEIRGIADKMITLGKKGDLAAKRMAFAYIQSRDVVAKLFDTLAPRSANRPGGYTRIIKTRVRNGDSAPMALISWLTSEGEYAAGSQRPRKRPEAAAAGSCSVEVALRPPAKPAKRRLGSIACKVYEIERPRGIDFFVRKFLFPAAGTLWLKDQGSGAYIRHYRAFSSFGCGPGVIRHSPAEAP